MSCCKKLLLARVPVAEKTKHLWLTTSKFSFSVCSCCAMHSTSHLILCIELVARSCITGVLQWFPIGKGEHCMTLNKQQGLAEIVTPKVALMYKYALHTCTLWQETAACGILFRFKTGNGHLIYMRVVMCIWIGRLKCFIFWTTVHFQYLLSKLSWQQLSQLCPLQATQRYSIWPK